MSSRSAESPSAAGQAAALAEQAAALAEQDTALAEQDAIACCPPLTDAPLSAVAAAELATVLSALADPVRLRLLSLVAAQGEVCSCNLEEPLGKSQPTVSHHTRVLCEAGLITGERRGKWMWWSVVPERLALLGRVLGGAEGTTVADGGAMPLAR